MQKADSLRTGLGAVLIGMNLVISCSALLPFLLRQLYIPSVIGLRYRHIGDVAMVIILFNLYICPVIGKIGFRFCVPFLTATAIVLPAMLLVPKIPLSVKLLCAVVQLLALALLYHTVSTLHAMYLHYEFKGLY
jgi:hypothetical protein